LKWDNPEFKNLQTLWYEKLQQTGFEDIENRSENLKQWNNNFFRNRFSPISYQQALLYYEKAMEFLLPQDILCLIGIRIHFMIQNPVHKKIWELHSQGMTERKISAQIKVYKKSMVHYIISKIRVQMKSMKDTYDGRDSG